jgi:uncharacterized protein YlxW (UPF0749 family)
MRSMRSQLTIALVAVILGFLVVVQLRAQSGGSSLDSKSIADLTAIITQLNAGNDQLRDQKTTEQETLAKAQADQQRGQSASSDAQSDLNSLGGWAGIDPIFGPGITLTMSGAVPGDSVEDAINELWSAGADGIAVNGVRIVPGVVVWGDPGSLQVDGKPVGSKVVITAIGDPDTLTGALRRPGGFLSQLGASYPNADPVVTPEDYLTLPATGRDLIPRNAQPRL